MDFMLTVNITVAGGSDLDAEEALEARLDKLVGVGISDYDVIGIRCLGGDDEDE